MAHILVYYTLLVVIIVMYYVCEIQKILENIVKRSEFGYTREQRYTKVIYYYYYQNKKKTMAQLSFDTPGSKVDRSMAFDLVINHEDKQLEVSAASPWAKTEFKGQITIYLLS